MRTAGYGYAQSSGYLLQNLELATLLAGQIARAAAIFNVDEVRAAGRLRLMPACCGCSTINTLCIKP